MLSLCSAMLGEQPAALRLGFGLGIAFLLILEGSYAAIFEPTDGPVTPNRIAAVLYYGGSVAFGHRLWIWLSQRARRPKR
jgi:hypothetical protein